MTSEQSVADRQAVLDAERAVNEQYMRAMSDLIDRAPHLIQHVAVTQSAIWNSNLPSAGVGRGAMSPIIGRVALDGVYPLLGDGFYIAGWHQEFDNLQAVSWAAPVAKLFFEGRESTYELAHAVRGRRTFVVRFHDLIDYQDELDLEGRDPFVSPARHLDVPAAPKRRERPPTQDAPIDLEVTHDHEQAAELDADREHLAPSVLIDDLSDIAPLARDEDLRAGLAVAKVIEMPKTGRLASVLATLQPEQYRLVSWPHNRPLIVQGQPGTGKTVIATHRAAYLTHDERKSERITRIALIGPSDHYVEHVTPLISEIKDTNANVRVLSLPAYLRRIVELNTVPKPGPSGLIESTWELGRAVHRAVRAMPSKPSSGQMNKRVRHVVDLFVQADSTVFPEAEILNFVRRLPKWPELSSQERYLPMLATIALALNPSQNGGWVGHLIVDEAQDVTPIEWRLLTTSLLEARGELTLFGDVNQRRSDWCASSWENLSADLEITEDDGTPPIEVIENGYRSTQEILRFANRLLPKGSRSEHALRKGTAPHIVKTIGTAATRTTVDAAIELTTRHQGLVAVVALDTRHITTELRKRAWTGGRQSRWTDGSNIIVVLHPDQARGLEYDAVVVLEPSSFPENVGRQGLLYTSLTRANKELTVVHTAPLPKELR